jgi:protein-L-isoaspartate(D-aspartate) O-methyltransferase
MDINFPNNLMNEKRRQLISSLRKRDDIDSRVLDAMLKLPREIFINQALSSRAYEDSALPIDCNQSISQPYTVAYMTSLLNIKKGSRILEIGTGSGYQACLLFLLGAQVFTIERIDKLYKQSSELFKKYGFNITTRLGDGTLGWKDFAPYNGILVTAAAPEVPNTLLNQLAIGGRLVVPIGDKDVQTMNIIEREEESKFSTFTSDKFKFVPLIGKEGWLADENSQG